MINNNVLVNREFVKSLVYTTASKNRDAYSSVVINGRRYEKEGTLQTVTIVGNVFKYFNTKTKTSEYWLMCGMAKQHPADLKNDKRLAAELADERAWIDPFIVMKVNKQFGKNTFADMMRPYVDDMDLDYVMTAEEIKNKYK